MKANTQEPLVVNEDNLSRAWAKAFLHVLDHPGTAISPLVVSLTGFSETGEPGEDGTVRTALDACLSTSGYVDVETVAWTIFPQSLWRLARHDRHRLFDLYKKTVPRYRAMNKAKNRRGLYFERLIAFGGGPMEGNQLEWIITQQGSRRGVRASMLQAAVFDPARDHVPDAQLAFPCLQHVTFVRDGDSLVLNAFYATQQLYDKAYGNWLGLCRLGQFMALEMGLNFARFNCFAGIEKLERVAKHDATLPPLELAARTCIGSTDKGSSAAEDW